MKRIWFLLVLVFFFLPNPALATVTQDNTAGTYTNDFNTVAGTSSTYRMGIDISSGSLKLKNSGGTYTAPYYTTGYVYTSTITPLFIAKWGTITISATTPAGTSYKVQVLDETNHVFPDTYLAGNESGFSTTTIDISSLSIMRTYDSVNGSSKMGRIRIKITFSTSAETTDVTPEIDSLAFTWTKTAGDLSASVQGNTGSSGFGENSYKDFSSTTTLSNPYYTMKWVYELGADSSPRSRIDILGNIVVKSMNGTNASSVWQFSKMMSLNPATGAVNYLNAYDGPGSSGNNLSVSQNNTGYIADIYNDSLFAFDLTTATVKWIYNFTAGGHGSDEAVVHPNGNIFMVRVNSSNKNATVWAFSPGGSVLWSKLLTETGINATMPLFLVIDGAGHIVLGYKTLSLTTGYNTNNGKILSLLPTDGSTVWSDGFGDVGALISDSSGNIIAVSGDDEYRDELRAKKIQKFDPDGNTLWQTDLGTNYDAYVSIVKKGTHYLLTKSLGTLPVPYVCDNEYRNHYDQVLINQSDGSVVSTIGRIGEVSYNLGPISDSAGNMVRIDQSVGCTAALIYPLTKIIVSDTNNVDKTTLTTTVNYQGYYPIMDASKRIFFGLSYFSFITFNNYDSKILALFPWTLTPSVTADPAGYFEPGDTVSFSVVTSMQETNLLNSGANKIQVVVDNGDKTALSYSSTNGDGDTVWTGTYIVPTTITNGTRTYTVEASADGVTTDIATTFASPADDSGNTGYTTTGTISVDNGIDTNPNLISPKGYCRDCVNPTLVFDKAVDSRTGLSSGTYTVYLDNAYTATFPTSGSNIDNSTYFVTYDTNRISVYFKGTGSTNLTAGKHTWAVKTVDNGGYSSTAPAEFFVDRISPTVSGFYFNNTGERPVISGTLEDPFGDYGDSAGSSWIKVTVTRTSDNKVVTEDTFHIDSSQVTTSVDKKYYSFYYTLSERLATNNEYKVNIKMADAVDNVYDYPTFYLNQGVATTVTTAVTNTITDFLSPNPAEVPKTLPVPLTKNKTVKTATLRFWYLLFLPLPWLFIFFWKRRKKKEKQVKIKSKLRWHKRSIFRFFRKLRQKLVIFLRAIRKVFSRRFGLFN